ncbi:MAG: hypothetical protein ACOYJA_01230 [Christensenellales bacterium]|jgi:hypothetical protein
MEEQEMNAEQGENLNEERMQQARDGEGPGMAGETPDSPQPSRAHVSGANPETQADADPEAGTPVGEPEPTGSVDAPATTENEAVAEPQRTPLDEEQRQIARRITADMAKIQVKYDRRFDLAQALEEDEDFRRLIFSGVSALEAYEMTQLPRRLAAEQAQRQKTRRQARPQTAEALGKGEAGMDFATMPEDQFARIEERLARGEKVYLDR